ncbi:MAG: hypothetical protein RL499_1113 [Actinomycetota bacterium]
MFTPTTVVSSAACLPPGSGADPVGDLQRQGVLVGDLRERVVAVLALLPESRSFEGWWGPARDALHESLGIERARLEREVARLDSVRVQLDAAASHLALGGPG